MTGPTDFEALETVLHARSGDFTPQQRRVAERLLSDPGGCAFLTVTQLADAVDVNESTVVRFAMTLGLDGYPELIRLCQQRLRDQAQLVQDFQALTRPEDRGEGLLARVATLDQANIVRTFAAVDEGAWEHTVRVLHRARRIIVVGHRKSFAPASMLAYLLGLVRDEVHQLPADHRGGPELLRGIGTEDALIALAIHRYERDSVRALRVAQRLGAATVALTDNPSSPLRVHSDHVFYAEVAGVGILRSMTAVVALVQALANAVATELGADSRGSLLPEEQLLSEFDVYEATAGPRDERGEPPSERRRASRGGT